MPVPTTPTAALDMVRRSGLIPNDRLVNYLQGKHGHIPTDPPQMIGALINDGLLTKFQGGQILKGRYKNFTIGRYKVLEPIGVGGMSRVYLCEHLTMGHRVAMKLLPMQARPDPSMVERFFREARAVATLNHPNIVRAHDVAEEAGKFHYLVMEYVEGVNLHQLVKQHGPLSPLRVAHYIAQAAEGLQHIHESRLVHRDLKPGNLLIDRAGQVKILDLGLARFNDPETSDSITKKYDQRAILGTADFLSPEQAIQSSTVDIRSDIYSLGATMYYLLVGRPPFPGDNLTQKLLSHQMKQPDRLAELRPELPADLIAIVEKMMAKDPEERYALPADVLTALSPWLTEPIEPPDTEEFPMRGSSSSGTGSQPTGRANSTSTQRRSSSSFAVPPLLATASSSQTPGPRSQLSDSVVHITVNRRWLVYVGAAIVGVGLAGLMIWFNMR